MKRVAIFLLFVAIAGCASQPTTDTKGVGMEHREGIDVRPKF